MAGEVARDIRESVGPAVVPKAQVARTPARALRPQDCLQPLSELFAHAGHREDFLKMLCEYVRLLLGAEVVILHEAHQGENKLVGFSTVDPARLTSKAWMPSEEAVAATFEKGKSNQNQVIVEQRQHARLMVPFFTHGEPPICLTAYLPPERIAFADPCFAMLHLTTQFVVQRDLLEDALENEQAFVQATMLVDMFSRTGDAETFKRSLFTLATELEKFFGCQRVAIGTGSTRACKVHAVSGMSSEEKRTLGFSQLGAAMREAIALEQTLVWPGQSDAISEAVVSANHDDLLHSFKSSRIILAPLLHEPSGTNAVVALLWPAASPDVNRRTYRLISASQPHLAALVSFLKKSKPGTFRGGLIQLWNKGLAKRLATAAAIVLLIATLLFPIPYKVSANCVIQPVLRRTVAAPFENTLYRTYVKPGDTVEKDQILAELDGREIRVNLAESIAAQSAAVKNRDNAMVLEDPATFQMAQLEADRLALEVERLQFRSDNLIIRSPLDGVVLTGNLERSEGVPVRSGERLFEIAPLDKMVMEVAIPETSVRHIEVGDEVRLRLESDTGRTWESTLSSLYPIAEIQDGENVFVGEAGLENEEEILRPGMKGSVRIVAEKRSIGWILFHGLWEYLRLKLW